TNACGSSTIAAPTTRDCYDQPRRERRISSTRHPGPSVDSTTRPEAVAAPPAWGGSSCAGQRQNRTTRVAPANAAGALGLAPASAFGEAALGVQALGYA